MKYLVTSYARSGSRGNHFEEEDTLPTSGGWGRRRAKAAASPPPPSPPTRALRSRRLRLFVEPERLTRAIVHVDGLAQMCICAPSGGLSAALPPFYWFSTAGGATRTWIQCPTSRPVPIEVARWRSLHLTIGASEGTIDPYFVEVTVLYG